MVSQAELKKRRVKAAKQQVHQEQVAEPSDRRRKRWLTFGIVVLALALIAPLAAGLFATLSDDDESTTADIPEIPLDTTPPSLVDPGFEGASLTGATPCPATDGTQERVTSFETAPSGCLDLAATYSVSLGTLAGDAVVELDTVGAPEAADLFVALARYGVYVGAPITTVEGLSIIGGFGDAGFVVPATEPPADGTYPVGSVVMFPGIAQGQFNGQIAIVTSETGATLLADDGTSAIIGTVADGLDAFNGVADLALENAGATYRLRSADVTETAG